MPALVAGLVNTRENHSWTLRVTFLMSASSMHHKLVRLTGDMKGIEHAFVSTPRCAPEAHSFSQRLVYPPRTAARVRICIIVRPSISGDARPSAAVLLNRVIVEVNWGFLAVTSRQKLSDQATCCLGRRRQFPAARMAWCLISTDRFPCCDFFYAPVREVVAGTLRSQA